jgi:hypothetical protein
MVSGSISPPYSGYFSPFPHGTRSLSVSQEYLALPDGAGKFNRDFSCPGLLRIPTRYGNASLTGLSPSVDGFPTPFSSHSVPFRGSYYPRGALTPRVWAVPLSLAATPGITVVFSSYGYLDVSVPHVRLPCGMARSRGPGCPIRKPVDQFACADPHSLSQLVTSFFASESLGIPRAPLFT